MNLQPELLTTRGTSESRSLWQNNLAWWVNCLAVEATWFKYITSADLPEARRRRDLMLEALVEAP